ncbi:hypothetical protein VM1G_11568 [Cytospora mali]|uniref:Uncharacterized protein n=1 Tax=Cytospora mali TaxID=578113 RepID=A0A194VYJ6_CYTMA|nr:hypothetical protein VM1G_11568 [Valsa mali]
MDGFAMHITKLSRPSFCFPAFRPCVVNPLALSIALRILSRSATLRPRSSSRRLNSAARASASAFFLEPSLRALS